MCSTGIFGKVMIDQSGLIWGDRHYGMAQGLLTAAASASALYAVTYLNRLDLSRLALIGLGLSAPLLFKAICQRRRSHREFKHIAIANRDHPGRLGFAHAIQSFVKWHRNHPFYSHLWFEEDKVKRSIYLLGITRDSNSRVIWNTCHATALALFALMATPDKTHEAVDFFFASDRMRVQRGDQGIERLERLVRTPLLVQGMAIFCDVRDHGYSRHSFLIERTPAGKLFIYQSYLNAYPMSGIGREIAWGEGLYRFFSDLRTISIPTGEWVGRKSHAYERLFGAKLIKCAEGWPVGVRVDFVWSLYSLEQVPLQPFSPTYSLSQKIESWVLYSKYLNFKHLTALTKANIPESERRLSPYFTYFPLGPETFWNNRRKIIAENKHLERGYPP